MLKYHGSILEEGLYYVRIEIAFVRFNMHTQVWYCLTLELEVNWAILKKVCQVCQSYAFENKAKFENSFGWHPKNPFPFIIFISILDRLQIIFINSSCFVAAICGKQSQVYSGGKLPGIKNIQNKTTIGKNTWNSNKYDHSRSKTLKVIYKVIKLKIFNVQIH